MTTPKKRILLAFHCYLEAWHKGALRYCTEQGWEAQLINSDRLGNFPAGSFDGVVGMLPPSDHPVHRFVAASGVPVVEMSSSFPENRTWVRCPCDPVAIGRMAAEYLRRRPVASIAFIAHGAAVSDDLRGDAFRLRLLETGDERPAITYYTEIPPESGESRPGPSSSESARLGDFLKSRPLPAGIFTPVDATARHTMDAALAAGLSIPEDIHLLGFGNRELITTLAPVPLSSIGVDDEAWAYRATQVLHGAMKGLVLPGSSHPVPPEGVVERRSTGGETGGDPLCERALKIMREHTSNPLNVVDLAARLQVSKSTLNRVFTEAYGTGVAARYLALRLEIAKGLLGAGEKVESVATSVGFASPRAFREAFIKSTGCRPGGFVPGRSGFTPVPFRLSAPVPTRDSTSSKVN